MESAKKLRHKPKLLFPETKDARILEAIHTIIKEQIAVPVVLEDPQHIQERYEQINTDDLVYIPSANWNDLNETLNFSAQLLNQGEVDGVIAGAVAPSAQVLKVIFNQIGLDERFKTISGSMFIILDHKVYLFSDVAVTIEPTPEQLVDIVCASVDTWERVVRTEPIVALLSFSTLGSAKHSTIHNVLKAKAFIANEKPHLNLIGEVQFDAAVDPTIASKKGIDLPLDGANIMIFPNLHAANIGYKIAQQFGNAKTIAVIQGLKKPFFDLSRGCTVDEILATSALVALYTDFKNKDVQ